MELEPLSTYTVETEREYTDDELVEMFRERVREFRTMEMLSASPGPCIGFVVGLRGPESLTFVPCGMTSEMAQSTLLQIHQHLSRQIIRSIFRQEGENHDR